MIRPFLSEQEMVEAFLYNSQLDIKNRYTNWKSWGGIELTGLFGIPDVVMAFGKINPSGQKIIRTYAFELKLRNWQRALVQAFKYSAFSNYSFVVLDESNVQPALAKIMSFQRANIGLLTLNIKGEIKWYNSPKYQKPYSPQLYKELSQSMREKLF